jgi:acetyl esterase/lipase
MKINPVRQILSCLFIVLLTACNLLDGPDRWNAENPSQSETKTGGDIIALENHQQATIPVTLTPNPSPQPVSNPIILSYGSSQLETGKTIKDLTYCNSADEATKMDLYYPKEFSKSNPVVVFIHGGGWSGGDKSDLFDHTDFPALMQAGFSIAAINYRLAPVYPFPIPIQDAKCAVRFLRANAKSLQLDPDRIGVMGDSAGGHLAAMLGAADASAKMEGAGGWTDVSSQIQAVVEMYAPVDLSAFIKNVNGSIMVRKVFDQKVSPTTNQLRLYSPITYISKNDPPVLIIHGEMDNLVPIDQANAYFKLLQKNNVPAVLIAVKNAGHGLIPSSQEINPSRNEISDQIVLFFKTNLRKTSD